MWAPPSLPKNVYLSPSLRIPKGVSGQANPLIWSVRGGLVRFPAASRCCEDSTCWTAETAGLQICLTACARAASEDAEMIETTQTKTTETFVGITAGLTWMTILGQSRKHVGEKEVAWRGYGRASTLGTTWIVGLKDD